MDLTRVGRTQMSRRSQEDPPSATSDLTALQADVDALKTASEAELRRRVAEIKAKVDQLKRDAEERERRQVGGPCIYCGASKAHGWNGKPGRQWCSACQSDKGFHLGDAEHRSMILRRILSGDWTQRRYAAGTNAQTEVRRAGFTFFTETPGATPGGWERWAYLDQQAIRVRAAQVLSTGPPPAPKFESGDPCSRCGCAHLYRSSGSNVLAVPQSNGHASHSVTTREPLVCQGCATFSSLKQVAFRIIGIDVGAGVGTLNHHQVLTAIGVTWFDQRPANPKEDLRKLTLAPWAYLPLVEIRKRYAELKERRP